MRREKDELDETDERSSTLSSMVTILLHQEMLPLITLLEDALSDRAKSIQGLSALHLP